MADNHVSAETFWPHFKWSTRNGVDATSLNGEDKQMHILDQFGYRKLTSPGPHEILCQAVVEYIQIKV